MSEIVLRFVIGNDRYDKRDDLGREPGIELWFDCFLGDVIFKVGDSDYSACWGWVPVFDFAVQLKAIADSLVSGGKETFDFTESGECIFFERVGDGVKIWASYNEAVEIVDFDGFHVATKDFYKQTLNQLARDYPAVVSYKEFSVHFPL